MPHLALEALGYAAGARIYWKSRDRSVVPARLSDRLLIVAGAACGAALGSKLLFAVQYAASLSGEPVAAWLSGKTVVGGLLGGWAGVETAKRVIGWPHSTGDRFVWPFAVALMLGRAGCQLAGPWDLTYGSPSRLPWGWNYGDGIPRHPVAVYEIAGLVVLMAALSRTRENRPAGVRFRRFVAGYLLLRFLLDFLKPPFGQAVSGVWVPALHAGLTAIQWACVGGIALSLAGIFRAVPARTPRD